jgi:hypothetical protein
MSSRFDPLIAGTVQQLVGLALPAGPVDLHTRWPGAKGYPLRHRFRGVGHEVVASECLGLTCAGGRAWEALGAAWNGRGRLFALEIDHDPAPAAGKRGCNHPDHDGGAAEAELLHVIWEATGGDVAITSSCTGRGRWYLAVVPEGVDGLALAKHCLQEMELRGFAVGPGRLEAPAGVARLPLAGYQLLGSEHLPWIAQAGTLVSWVAEQQRIVRLRVDLPEPEPVVVAEPEVVRLTAVPRRGIDLAGIEHLGPGRSNDFVMAVAARFVRSGHTDASAELMQTLIEAHPGWRRFASAESRDELQRGKCRRALVWAMRRQGSSEAPVAGLSNDQKHHQWNAKVRAGIAAAVAAGVRSVTRVIVWLTEQQQMSRQLLWRRVELIRQGLDREVQIAEMNCSTADLAESGAGSPTQSIPMGGEPAVPCSESIEMAVLASPAASAEPATCAAMAESQQESLADPAKQFIRAQIDRIRSQIGHLIPKRITISPDSLPQSPSADLKRAGPEYPLRVDADSDPYRSHQRDELARWLGLAA